MKSDMTDMKSDMTDMKSDMTDMKSDMTDMKSDMTDMKSEMKSLGNTVTRIEHDHGQKLQVLFDGYIQHSQQLERIEEKVDALTVQVESHDVKIRVINGGKRKVK
jgi:predicted nuclease with TOPRIM domain